MSAIKTGAVANNRFAVIIDRHHKHLTREIPVDRSGGGLWRGQSILWARAPFFGAHLPRDSLLTKHFCGKLRWLRKYLANRLQFFFLPWSTEKIT